MSGHQFRNEPPPPYTEEDPNQIQGEAHPVSRSPDFRLVSLERAPPYRGLQGRTDEAVSANSLDQPRINSSASIDSHLAGSTPARPANSTLGATSSAVYGANVLASQQSYRSLRGATTSTTLRSDGVRKYRIGTTTITKPLVGIEYLKAHLGLLGAFQDLRERVTTCPGENFPAVVKFLDEQQRWAWFVDLAVERFHCWVRQVKREDLATWVTEEIPPLDVLMVWHAYLLNPIWYAEDCGRLPVLCKLQTLGDMFVPAVVVMGDLARYQPTENRVLAWFEQTDTPFDPADAMTFMTHRAVHCPKCGKAHDIPYLTSDGTGYSQRNFRCRCACGLSITKNALALDKLARNVVLKHRTTPRQADACLAGTLHTRTNERNWYQAWSIKDELISSETFNFSGLILRDQWKERIQEKLGYSIVNIPGSILRANKKTLNAYKDDRPFSVDLVGAVLRQGIFIDKMESFGWTKAGYFDEEEYEVILQHAIARYHAFLDMLAASSAGSAFVPTLDIDLVWHTHQLAGSKYMKDCKSLIGWYVNHDDKIEENYLANALDETSRAWSQRFHVPYMHCGCPLPSDTLGDKLQRLTRFIGPRDERCDMHAGLQLPPHPDATHASEHNSVRVKGKYPGNEHALSQKRLARQEELRRRRERDAQRVREGKMNEELYRRGQAHIDASLMPVSFAESAAPDQFLAPCVAIPGPLDVRRAGQCAVVDDSGSRMYY